MGQRCARARRRLLNRGCRTTAWGAIAADFGLDAKDARVAVQFVEAVDRICNNCGAHQKALLLSGHPRLPHKIVMRISRTHADRQRYALEQVRNDRNPFQKPPVGIDPPFDTHDYDEVFSRLRRNAGLLDFLADGLLATSRPEWPDECVKRIAADEVKHIRQACRQWTQLLNPFRPRAKGQRSPTNRPTVPAFLKERKPFNPKAASAFAASVRGISEKNVRELPRLLRETPPTAREVGDLLYGVRRLDQAADRLAAVVRAGTPATKLMPLEVPGTYIVFYHLPEPVTRLTIGRLGTFDFPSGYYAYLGSAFGGGGVRKRTNRHLTRCSAERWNIDWLKPHCTPVAVWWTHDRNKVEFAWADLLASLPGASFPAPRFGAADNDRAEAHLVRFETLPECDEFRRRVKDAMPAHLPILCRSIKNWTGFGWPV